MVYKYMGPTTAVVRPWVQQKSAGYWWPSDLIVPREATATTIRCYAMTMTGNAHYCSVRPISPRSLPSGSFASEIRRGNKPTTSGVRFWFLISVQCKDRAYAYAY